jgi:formylglycine-generating enzyme required for sulfatase activity
MTYIFWSARLLSRGARPTLVSHATAIACAAMMGCDEGGETVAHAPADPGPTVSIDGQELTVGFALGQLRKTVEVDSFRISQHPVTLGEYRACMNAGRCQAPPEAACTKDRGFSARAVTRKPNFRDEGASPDVAATCVGLQGARQYCASVGGVLPSLDQWLLAARGSSPRRHAWGSEGATCAQHAYAIPVPPERCDKPATDLGRVGLHPAGASPSGVQDVLLTTGELLDASADAFFTACRKGSNAKPGSDRGCIAYGLRPGSIDSVRELRLEPDRPDSTATPYGFRCAWGGAS